MFISAFKKAQDAVEDVAVEAALGLMTILLACAAFLFAAAAAAFWLSTMMPPHFSLLVTAAVIGVIAVIIYNAGLHKTSRHSEPKEKDSSLPPAKPFSSVSGPLDILASGLFARQFKKAPLETVAATAAVGALIGMIADSLDDDD